MKRRQRSAAEYLHIRCYYYAKACEEAFQEYLENRIPQEYNRFIGILIADQIVSAANFKESIAAEYLGHDCVAAPGQLCPVCEPF